MSQPQNVGPDHSVETPRLRVIAGQSAGPVLDVEPEIEHNVPATVRHAESMTGEALALRLQAIARLGVASTVHRQVDPRPEPVGPELPDARAWGSRLVQAVSEVLAGDRPISQLVRFTDEAVFTELNRRVRLLGLSTTATGRGASERSAVRSVRVCKPARHVAEVAAHVRHGDRSRAIALRMEIRRNRWVCTALELG
jgi:hypothetical protein